ncbi:MAG: twin-arginine translocation signal domain-containing protein [Phycisphaerae bacterium]
MRSHLSRRTFLKTAAAADGDLTAKTVIGPLSFVLAPGGMVTPA